MPSPADVKPRPPARIPTPGEVGLRRILSVADVLLGGMEEGEMVEHLLPVLRRAVPADSVLWLTGDRHRPTVRHIDPAGAATTEQAAALDTHHAADPLLTRAWSGPGAAIRRSDLHTDPEFRRLPTFATVFGPLHARRQLAMGVHPDETRHVLVLFNREHSDFTHHDLAVAEALRPRIGRALARFGSPSMRREKVSPREADVLDLLCRGLTDRQIATRLGISPRTVDKHLEHAYVKLGVRCRVQAATRWQS